MHEGVNYAGALSRPRFEKEAEGFARDMMN